MDDLGNAFKKALLNNALEIEDAITIVIFVIDNNVTCFSWKSYLSIKKFKKPKKTKKTNIFKVAIWQNLKCVCGQMATSLLPFSSLSPSNPMEPEISVGKVGRIETDNRNM